jgi:hypothetical protein
LKISPAWILFFLAPAIGELLSGSAPPAEFFNPISLLLLSALYGSGALLVRELKIRWNKGYVSLFILGAAYGVIEEGLMVKSFFDPGWMDLGLLGVYGRWWEVNWVWAEWLTIYHAIFSIVIPITLVEAAYPHRRNDRWLSNARVGGVVILLCAVTVFGYGFLTAYRPPPLQYLLTIVLTGALFLLAWKIPNRTGRNGHLNPSTPSRLVLCGFLTTLALFLLFGAGTAVISSPLVLMLLGAALVVAIFSLLRRYEWNERSLYHKFALAAGALGFFVALTPLQELDSSRLDNTQGMLVVGIIATIMLVLVRRKLRACLASLDEEDTSLTFESMNIFFYAHANGMLLNG